MRRGAKAAAAVVGRAVGAVWARPATGRSSGWVQAVVEELDQRMLLSATAFGAVETGVSGVGRGVALTVDANGNLQAIVTSVESGAGAGTASGGAQTTVAKFTAAGAADLTFGSGSGSASVAVPSGGNRVGGIAVDANGNIFVAGASAGASGAGDTDAYLVTVPQDGSTATAAVMPSETSTVAGSSSNEGARAVVIGTAGDVQGRPVLAGDLALSGRRLQALWPYVSGTATTVGVLPQHFAATDPTAPGGDDTTASYSGLSAVAMDLGGAVPQPFVVVGGYETVGGATRLFVSRLVADNATGDPNFGGDPMNGGARDGSFRLTLPATSSASSGNVSVAVDPSDDSIYVAEAQNGTAGAVTNVYHLDSSGNVVQTYGGGTVSATAHASVSGIAASGIAVEPRTGRVFLVDENSMTLVGLSPNGQLSGLFSGQTLGNESTSVEGELAVQVSGGATGGGIAYADGEVVATGTSSGGKVVLASAASPTTSNNIAVAPATNVQYDQASNTISFDRHVTATGSLSEGVDYNVEYYISADNALTQGDLLVSGTTDAGGHVTVSVPDGLAKGSYQIITRAVPINGAEQADASDDVAASGAGSVATLSSLIATTLSYSTTSVAAGTQISGGSVAVTYGGYGSANVMVQLALRPVGAADASQDVAIGSPLGPVTVSRTAGQTVAIGGTVPRATPVGNYVLVGVISSPAADALTTLADNGGPALSVTAAPAATSHLTIGTPGGYPATLQASNSLRGSFTVQNSGTATTAIPFEVRLRPVNGGSDIVLGTVSSGAIGADSSATVPFTIVVPGNTPTADYDVVVDINANDLPVESDVTNANGEAVGPAVHIATLRSRIAVSGVTYAATTSPAGGVVHGTVTLVNNSGAETSPVTVGLFLRPVGVSDESQDLALPTVDTVVVTGFTIGGGEARSADFDAEVPRSVSPGSYVIVAKATGVDEETQVTNPAGQAGPAIAVTAAPALVSHVGLTGITYTTKAATLGQAISGTVKVQNTGTAATDPVSVRLVLRPVGAADASQDVRVGTIQTAAIGAGATVSTPFSVTVPSTVAVGNYQLVAIIPVAPNAATDVTTASTGGAAIRITRGPDLVATIIGPTGIVEGGKRVTVKARIENIGDTAINGKVTLVIYAVGGELAAGPASSVPSDAIAVGIKMVKVNLKADTSSNHANPPSTKTISFKVKVIDQMSGLDPLPKATGSHVSSVGRVRFMAAVNIPAVTSAPVPEADTTNNIIVSSQSLDVPAHVVDLVMHIEKVTRKGATVKITNIGAKDANSGGELQFFALDQQGGNTGVLLATKSLSHPMGGFKLVGGGTKSYSVKFKPDQVVLGAHFVRATVIFGGENDPSDNSADSATAVAFT